MDPDNPQSNPAQPDSFNFIPSNTPASVEASINASTANYNAALERFNTAEQRYYQITGDNNTTAEAKNAAAAEYRAAGASLTKATSDYATAYRQGATIAAQQQKNSDPYLEQERQARVAYLQQRAAAAEGDLQIKQQRLALTETPEQKAAREAGNIAAQGQNQQNLEKQRADAQQANTQLQGKQASDLESQRSQDTMAQQAQQAQLQGQQRLLEIGAQRDAAIQEAQQKFAQDQDLEQLRATLNRANSEALAQAQAELTRQTELQRFQLQQPYTERDTAARESEAQSRAQEVAQQGQYQQGELDLRGKQLALDAVAKQQQNEFGYRDALSKQLGEQSNVGLGLGNEGVKYGAAPVAGLGKAIADPLQMAYQILHEGLQNGSWGAERIPGYFGAPSPQGGQGAPQPQAQGAPDPASLMSQYLANHAQDMQGQT